MPSRSANATSPTALPEPVLWGIDLGGTKIEGVIVDGSFGAALRGRLLAALGPALDRHCWEGVERPAVLAGTIGSDARAVGGALLPLYANFAPDRDLFLKMAS